MTSPAQPSHTQPVSVARRICRSLLLAILPAFVTPSGLAAATAQPDYLSDHPELILSNTQDWGVLGFDSAAHAPDKEGVTLQIGEKTFAKGLGHHANGVISLMTDGQYESFDAEIGVQPCSGGSVIFRVIVDGHPRFDSGVMRSGDAPKPVHVSVAGAQEVRLEANDAGDGINCDMANWADARLVLAANATKVRRAETSVDMAPFARVVTWDPKRLDGARARRIEEFRADDLFTETELKPNRSGSYSVPAWTNGVGCIGLQWLNRRALRELALEFADATKVPATNAVRVEGWFGESAWQGNWRPLNGEFHREGARLIFSLAPKAGVIQTQKIRWILPATPQPSLVRLSAFTRSSWATTNLFVQFERPKAGARGELTICNGEPVAKSEIRNLKAGIAWKLSQPLHVSVRFSRPSSFKSDPTVLQFRLPTGNVGVAVEDVLTNDCVYLPDLSLFVAREPLPVTLADYKRRIAGRKTILEEVRALPDQTLAQAMARTHHDFQREGPVLLSLACDNVKFVVERDGVVRCVVATNAAVVKHETWLELKPQFGDGKPGNLSRTLDGGWLPIPIITVARDGVEYRQRSFVAPCDEPGGEPARFNRRSVCVVEFTITNTQSNPAEAMLSLNFADRRTGNAQVKFAPDSRGWLVSSERGSLALAATAAATPLLATAQEGILKLSGTLPANGTAQFAIFVPAQADTALDRLEVAPLRAATEDYWKAVLAPAMQIATPDPLLNDVIRSSQVRCWIDARNEADGARLAAWIAAMHYGPLESESHSVIRGMDCMGHADFARRSLEFFVHRYNTNGFLTTGYTTFGTAWHLWTLGEHYQLTRDKAWLRQIAPEIARVGHWIVRQTDKTKTSVAADVRRRNESLPETPVRLFTSAATPECGLMPPGVLADWNSFAYHFAMNAYYSAALRGLGDALGDIGHPDATFFKRHAAELRANTLRAYAWTQSRSPALALRDGTWIPHYPSQVQSPGKLTDFFPGQDAGRSWCYDVELGAHQLVPTGVLDPRSREVERMLDHLEDVQFLADGWFDYPARTNHTDWFNLGGFSKVQPYYTRNCEVYALRDDVKPFVRSYFNTIAAMLNPEVLTMWEHFHHSGAWDKTHETGYFLHQTRTMLVEERGNELWLAPFATSNWLRAGQRVSVKNAPTRFGEVSYEIKSRAGQGYIEATINPPTRRTPRILVLRLRHPDGKPMRTVTVNGKAHRKFDPKAETVRIVPDKAATIVVRASY
ncbi:MAG: NPCBM/NEW2 domain-containing protein [Verrucomicrobia bacterium]|nr:NPCBM/NEW2 domain-containing protein [Verrucomicrobiota bacterium]